MPAQTDNISRALNRFVGRLTAQVARDVTPAIQEGNPVLTGFSQSNWIPQIGSPFEGVAGARFSDSAILDNTPRLRGLASLSTYNITDGPIYISNNVRYIVFLNTLHPNRIFVQRGIAAGIRRAITGLV